MPQGPLHLDQQRLKKETLSASAQRPVAVYPAAMGVLAGGYALAFGLNPLTLGVMAGGLAVGFGGWLFEYFGRGKKHALAIVERYRSALHERRVASIRKVGAELEILHHDAALEQLEQLTVKFANFENILGKKLDTSELTYHRYLATAEQVFLNALDNLEKLALGIQSVSAINIDKIQATLARMDEGDPARPSLIERQALWQQQNDETAQLLLENEQAMTQLDRVSHRLADVQTRATRAQMIMDDAMHDLEDLIQRTDRYGR